MACQSDIDLKTLHKKRLDERTSYKLSWFNQRFYDDEVDQHDNLHHHHHRLNTISSCNDYKTKQQQSSKAGGAKHSKSKAINTKASSTTGRYARGANDGNNNHAATSYNANGTCETVTRSIDFYDEGYFSSPTLSRRRSGTWP